MMNFIKQRPNLLAHFGVDPSDGTGMANVDNELRGFFAGLGIDVSKIEASKKGTQPGKQ